MESTETCTFCGIVSPAHTMDMTGLGWRCTACGRKSELAAANRQGEAMAEHLTRPELEAVAESGKTEAIAGAAIAFFGVVLTMFSILSGAQIFLVFSGMAMGGISLVFHGLHRRRHALAAIRQAPDARVVRSAR